MKYYHQQSSAFPPAYLSQLQGEIFASPYFTVNNLNRDFVGTKGFSIVFRRSHLARVTKQFPYFTLYLEKALQDDCNAFYLNPLLLKSGSRVDPHIDYSLRPYCKTIQPPHWVSVLYVQVPPDMQGGELILQARQHRVAEIRPQSNTLLFFQGDLTHSINPVHSAGVRLSLVCEQYCLEDKELLQIPEFRLESRATAGQTKKGKPAVF